MTKYYKLNENVAVITQVIKPAGGADRYKLFDSMGDLWYDSLSDISGSKEEITESQYRTLAASLQVLYAQNLNDNVEGTR